MKQDTSKLHKIDMHELVHRMNHYKVLEYIPTCKYPSFPNPKSSLHKKQEHELLLYIKTHLP